MAKAYQACALAFVVFMILGATSGIVVAKGKPDTPPGQDGEKQTPSPPGQDKRPETPPGHSNRPDETPSGTVPATPATPADPHPGDGPATPATPATPAQPGQKKDDPEPEEPEPEEEYEPYGFDVSPTYVWWYLTRYPTGGHNNLYPGAENVPGSWPITITAWETNPTPIDLYFKGTDFQSCEGYTFSITNLWIDDDSNIHETEETGADPYMMQNEYSIHPVFTGLAPGESMDVYFFLSFPKDQPITSYWAYLYIKAMPSRGY